MRGFGARPGSVELDCRDDMEDGLATLLMKDVLVQFLFRERDLLALCCVDGSLWFRDRVRVNRPSRVQSTAFAG